MFSGLLFVSFVKLFVCFCKDENIELYILIHTIQLGFFFFLNSKIAPFFCVVLPNLQVGKLKHCPMLLMLD